VSDTCECGGLICDCCWQCIEEQGHLPDCPWKEYDDSVPHDTIEYTDNGSYANKEDKA